MAKGKDHRYAELFLAALMFVSANLFSFLVAFISESALILNLAITILFFALAIAFVLFQDDTGARAKRGAAAHSLLIDALFIAIVVSYLVLFALNPSIWMTLLKNFWVFGVFFVAFLPLFFMVNMGTYLIRDGKKKAVVLLIVVFLILVLYYPSQVLVNGFRADDEELLVFESITAILNGTNPYGTSFYSVVYQNARNVSFTLTTASTGLMSSLAYPALFFLTFMPFYFASAPTLANLVNIDLPLQESVFAFVLIAAMAFLIGKKELMKPRLSLIALFVFALTNSASVTVYLMIALLMIAYVKIESRYSWLFLGICASIQEELWLPVLFLIAYSFNNHGIRKGITNMAGAAAVFLAINSYFIALSPRAYYESVFGPLNSFIFPNGFSSIGFSIVKFFPILLSTYTQLFEITALFLVFMLLYWNRKELIPLFTMVPFLVLDHSLNSYYVTFLLVLVFAIAVRGKKEKGWMEAALRKRKAIVFCVIAAFFVIALALIYTSHAAYERNFGISMSKPELIIDRINESSVYRTTLSYGNLSNSTIYVLTVGIDENSFIGMLGLLNSSIIDQPRWCH